MYQCNEDAKRIAAELGFIPAVNFIMAAKRNGYEYIRATVGKPQEFDLLRARALAAGFEPGPDSHHGGGHHYPSFYRRATGGNAH